MKTLIIAILLFASSIATAGDLTFQLDIGDSPVEVEQKIGTPPVINKTMEAEDGHIVLILGFRPIPNIRILCIFVDGELISIRFGVWVPEHNPSKLTGEFSI